MALELHKNDLLHEVMQDVAFGLPANSSQAFFNQLVTHLATTFKTAYAYVGLLDKSAPVPTIDTVASFAHDKLTKNFRYELAGTPCENVVGKMTCAHPRNAQAAFPNDPLLAEMDVESYIGAPLFDAAGEPSGLVAVLDTAPMHDIKLKIELLKIYCLRTAQELERMRSEIALQRSEQRFRTLVGNIPGAIYRCALDADWTMEYASDAFEALTGYRADQFVNRELHYAGIIHPDDQQMVTNTVIAAVKRHRPYIIEYRIIDALGEIRWVYEKGQAEFDNNSETRWLDGAIFDITERKQSEKELNAYRNHLEELVEQRTCELQAVIQELESFAYSVSHDLRTPLRAMHGFSRALQEDYADVLDDTADSYLKKICAASERMAELIDDLLRLSKVSRREMHLGQINLSKLAQQVVDNLRQHKATNSTRFQIQDDMLAVADSHLIRIALENLIGNACKYTRDTHHPLIEFGSTRSDDQTLYYLRDNGVGFDPRYADKLFGVFERLHGQEFEGTGIGLATVKRIINRHNGEIWGESEPGEGACFYFTL